MSRAALYIRVSTDEQAASADEQERGARAWCERSGHSIVAVYRDLGHSGAEWVTRPAIGDLERAARSTPRPFDLVVVRDADRLGRDAVLLPRLLRSLADRDVTVVESSTGRPLELDGVGLVVVNVMAALAQVERETIARRVRGALASKATRGAVTGGVVYGYVNVRGPEGVRYEVHEGQAAIVREIYERRARGESCRAIATLLNARGVPSPRAEGGGTGSWCRSTVHMIATSPRYKGEATWGKIGSRYRDGTRVAVRRDDAITYAVPVIVDAEVWQRAQRSTTGARQASKRAAPGPEPKHLLTGLAVCGICGHRIATGRTSSGSGDRRVILAAYCCAGHRDRGICQARYYVPVERLEAPILDWLVSDVLDPKRIEEASARARAILRATEAGDPRVAEIEARIADLAQRQTRVRRAIQTSDDEGLVADLADLGRDLDAARAEREAIVASAQVLPLDAERELVGVLRDLRSGMEDARERCPSRLRALLAAVLVGRVTVTPLSAGRGARYLLTASASPGALLSWRGVPGDAPTVGDPNGPRTVGAFSVPLDMAV